MNPKKPREVIVKQAEKVGIPVEDLANMIDMYYNELKFHMEEMSHLNIVYNGCGFFTTYRKQTKKTRDDLRKKYQKLVDSGIPESALVNNKTRIDMLSNMVTKAYIQKGAAMKKLNAKIKKKYEAKRNTATGLDKQTPDS